MSDIAEFLKLYNQLEFGGCAIMLSDHSNDRWDTDGRGFWWKGKDSDAFYSDEIIEGPYYDGDYVIYNSDNGDGTTLTRFFLVENRDENLSEDEDEEDLDD